MARHLGTDQAAQPMMSAACAPWLPVLAISSVCACMASVFTHGEAMTMDDLGREILASFASCLDKFAGGRMKPYWRFCC